MLTTRFSSLAALLGALLIAASLSLGGTSSVRAAPEDDIRATVQTAAAAFNAGDIARFLDQFTDKGISELFDGFVANKEEAAAELEFFIGEDQVRIISVENIRVFSGTATADVSSSFGIQLDLERWGFILVDGRWLVDSVRPLSAPIPAGVTAVPMHLVEYAFVYDRALAARGNIAFQVHNVGAEHHEIVLLRLDPALPPLLQVLMDDDPEGPIPEGIEFLGQDDLRPGEFRNFVLTEPLSAGRYGLVCFFPTPDGTPHAFVGMIDEFTVGPVTAPPVSVRPPATGDAGLAATTAGTTANLVLVLGTLMLVGGIGGIAYRRVSVR